MHLLSKRSPASDIAVITNTLKLCLKRTFSTLSTSIPIHKKQSLGEFTIFYQETHRVTYATAKFNIQIE